jgi:hypothetical protein
MSTPRVLISLAVAAGLSFSGTAQADSELIDRYVAASQQAGKQMLKLVENCAPGIDTSEVDFEYSERMTESANCLIETHVERYGRDETVALVEDAEAMSEREFSSFSEMMDMPEDFPRLTSPEVAEINQECGTVEASQDMPLSRLMQENMDQMMACFSE